MKHLKSYNESIFGDISRSINPKRQENDIKHLKSKKKYLIYKRKIENMKHLKSYNESIFGDISRSINPKRQENDMKLYNLFIEMEKDFVENGKNLKKVLIRDNKDDKIDFSRIQIGDFAHLTYIFGKYHPIENNIHSGNTRAGNRKIEISLIPFEFVLKKNSLEKSFHTSRISPQRITVKDTKVVDNLEYNPNVSSYRIISNLDRDPTESDRKKMVQFHEKKDEYKVSPDIAGDILKYFIDQYEKQYPNLGKYKGPTAIKDIEKGVQPTLKYIEVKSKDGESLTYGLRRGENEKEITNLLRNMTKSEYDIWWKKRNEERYEESSEKSEKKSKELKEKWENFFINLLEKYDITPKKREWSKNGIDMRVYDYSMSIFFVVENSDKKVLEEKIKSIIKEDFEDYVYEDYRVEFAFRREDELTVTIRFRKD